MAIEKELYGRRKNIIIVAKTKTKTETETETIIITIIMMMMIMMIMMTIHITSIINEFYCDLRVKFKRKKITLRKAKKKPERKFKLSTGLEPVYYRY